MVDVRPQIHGELLKERARKMNRIHRKIIFAAAVFFAISIVCPVTRVLSVDSRLVIIANPGVGDESIKPDFIRNVYLGKTAKWKDGVKAEPITLKGGEIHEVFLKELIGKSDSQFSTFWKKMVFTGKGRPPKEVANEAVVVEFVKSTPGAIGYVSASAPVEGVKVLKVD